MIFDIQINKIYKRKRQRRSKRCFRANKQEEWWKQRRRGWEGELEVGIKRKFETKENELLRVTS